MAEDSLDLQPPSPRYRLLGCGLAPQRIRIEKPGWGGTRTPLENGATPQPWHCLPFVEGATYGFELLYSLAGECRVSWSELTLQFEGEFLSHPIAGTVWPPFLTTNPGHYSLGSFVDMQVPDGWSLRIEPHPRFFTDTTGTVPIAVIGNIQSAWWPMFFFVTFKSPPRGQTHVFRHGEPYAQVIVVPEKAPLSVEPMSSAEATTRERQAQRLMKSRKTISRRRWVSGDGLQFDDLYKQLHRSRRSSKPMSTSASTCPMQGEGPPPSTQSEALRIRPDRFPAEHDDE